MPLDERGNALPPANVEAEEAILGSVFLDREVVGRCLPIARPQDFYSDRCRVAWGVMAALVERDVPVDPITLMEEYQRRNIEPDTMWLYGLLGVVPTPINAENYARIVREAADKRRLISIGGKIATLGWRDDEDFASALLKADEMLAELGADSTVSSWLPVVDYLRQYLDQEAFLAAGGGNAAQFMIPTGFPSLDRRIGGGLGRSDLSILAGRPGMGKTAFGVGIALNAALRFDVGVAFFSLEMAARQLVGRMLSIESMLPRRMLREATATATQLRGYSEATGRIADAPIWIDETPGLPITDLTLRARQLTRTADIGLVIVDHVQLIRGSNPRHAPGTREAVSEASLGLKNLARSLNVPVLALAQLNRAVDQRKPPEPMISDLRESGTLEQDADNVLLLFREGYYDKDSARPNASDLIIGKQRNGDTGRVPFYWDAGTTRFVDLDRFERGD